MRKFVSHIYCFKPTYCNILQKIPTLNKSCLLARILSLSLDMTLVASLEMSLNILNIHTTLKQPFSDGARNFLINF